jgi:lipopolysaccharide export LptBFGC system permease protein LptF
MAVTEQVKAQMESSNAQPEPKKEEILNLAVFGLKNRLFFVNRFTPHNGTMEGINILEHDPDQNVIRKVVANRGEYRNGMWVFFQSMTTELDQNGLVVNGPVYLEEEVMSIPETPQEFSHQRRLPEQMSIDQLRSYIDKLSDSGATGTLQKFKVELYRRFTSSITPLVIILLAIPFSLMVKKRATGLYALGISIIGGFLYYGINAISTALGYAGILPAWIATTFSHVLVITSSLYLIRSLP